MTRATGEGDVLRVAYPRACNTQQTGQNDATSHATTAQHAGLKALAQLALTRNNARNTDPEATSKPTQQTDHSDGAFVAQESGALRARLLALATAEGIDPTLVERLPAGDLDACEGLPDHVLRAYVLALNDTAIRHAGKVPDGDTASAMCARCGPVYVHPSIAACLPVVAGWPRALGCPWCFVRKAGRYIPRPMVACEQCEHYQPDPINPPAGMGDCGDGHGMHYPMQKHRCGSFRPRAKP